MSHTGKDKRSHSKDVSNSCGLQNGPSAKTESMEKPKRINAFKEMVFGPQDLLYEDVEWNQLKDDKEIKDDSLSPNRMNSSSEKKSQFQFNGKRGCKSNSNGSPPAGQSETDESNMDEKCLSDKSVLTAEENENAARGNEKDGIPTVASPSQATSSQDYDSFIDKGRFILERMPEYTDPSIPKGPTPPSPIEFKQAPPIKPAPKNRYTTGCWDTYSHEEFPPLPGDIKEDLENGPLGKIVKDVMAELEAEGCKIMEYDWMHDSPWKLDMTPTYTDSSIPKGPTPPSPIQFIQQPPIQPAPKTAYTTGPWETYAHGPAPPLPAN